MKNLVEELRWRGLFHDMMPGTEEQLLKEATTAYIGFDPTADSLHIGSLVQIILLMHLRKSGHKAIALVGGATGMIGDPSGKYMASTTDGPVNIFPTHKFKVPVNKANAIASGIAKPTDTLVDELLIDFNPNRQYLLKNELAMYAIIATSDFKRPICFTSTQELKELGLDKYVRQTGMSYQLVPVMNQTIDTEVAYKNMMTKFSFGNAKNPNVYFDEENSVRRE